MPNPSVMATYRSAWMVQLAIIAASLACGTAFWLVVQLTTFEETTFLVPIVPTGIPEEVLLDPSWEPKQTMVRFTVPRSIRDEIKPETFQIEVDLSNVKASLGPQLQNGGSTPLVLSDVKTGVDGVNPVEITARQISWTAQLRHAKARIVPEFEGEPVEGYERRGYTVTQMDGGSGNEMTVILSEAAERQFQTSGQELLIVKTEPIKLAGRNQSFLEKRALVFPYEGMSAFPERNTSVSVAVDIVEKMTSRMVSDVPVVYTTVRKGLYVLVDPPTVQVSVTGRTSVLRDLKPGSLRAEVWGIPELPGELRELEVICRVTDDALRPQIVAVEAIPRSVTVRVVAQADEEPEAAPSTDDNQTSPTPKLRSAQP
ncbi:hypothetical protein GC173_04840 [bacterium]|nr:hypothetical protein [bacterium]